MPCLSRGTQGHTIRFVLERRVDGDAPDDVPDSDMQKSSGVILSLEAVVAKVEDDAPIDDEPVPVEAPREFETSDARPESLARASIE